MRVGLVLEGGAMRGMFTAGVLDTLMDTLRASGSMPMVSRPVTINGKQYLDGGISDSIPYAWLADQGCDKIVVVLTQDAAYRKKPLPKAASLYGVRYPAIAAQLKNRHLRYNRCVAQLRSWEQEGRAFVIRPSEPITIGTIEKNPERLQAVYDLGVRNAAAQIEALRAYLANEASACIRADIRAAFFCRIIVPSALRTP